jgi:Winged helix DNA-binding domain
MLRDLTLDARQEVSGIDGGCLPPATHPGSAPPPAGDRRGRPPAGEDPASVYMDLRARTTDLARADFERALYDDRPLVEVLGMRRTMFVASPALAGVIDTATAVDIAVGERKRMYQMLDGAGIRKEPERWVAEVERETLDAPHELGEATAADLKRAP